MILHTLSDVLAPLPFAQLIAAIFLAILFVQSGLDKIFDWKGNLTWLSGHFEKSPLRNAVPFMLAIVTLFEIIAGFLSAAGAIQLLVNGEAFLALAGAQLAAVSLSMLFLGQRIAKDYAGAATLVPYFILAVATIVLMGGVG